MALEVTPVHRNLHQRVTFFYLEFEDLFIVIGLAAVPHRRAEDLMRLLQIGNEEAAGPPEVERRVLEKMFPVHV